MMNLYTNPHILYFVAGDESSGKYKCEDGGSSQSFTVYGKKSLVHSVV